MKTAVAILALIILSAVQSFEVKAQQVDSLVRRGVADIAVSAGGSVAFNAIFTEVLKSSVHELRPDRQSNNSFPSRHTSWAFTVSTILSNELYRYSPWYSAGALALASGIGMQRIMARRHYPSDVAAGAAIGVVSTELAYFISRRIFGRPNPLSPCPDNHFTSSVAVYTRALYWLNDLDYGHMCTSLAAGVDFRLPLSHHWGAGLSVGALSGLIKHDKSCDNVNGIEVLFGLNAHKNLPCRMLALEGAVDAGFDRLIRFSGRNGGFHGRVESGLSLQISNDFATRASVAYEVTTCPTFLSAISVSVSSVVCF